MENLENLFYLALDHRDTADLNSLRLGPTTSWLGLYELSTTTELTVLNNFPDVRNLYLATANTCAPRGLSSIYTMPGLHGLHLTAMHLPEWLTAREPLPAELRTLTLHECVMPGDSRVYRDLSSLNSLSVRSCRTPDGAPITALDLPVKDLTIV
ncbi:hypothetical protein [Streptomyces sp. NPDC051572]|uniref:hypothetical protein n=1 Tax=Streptomyces sp. NPDC051572 TaxID=3155802 RepID=UPI00344ED5A0